jgi:glycosyltransferase involved in cell wall biosynthesis
MSRNLKTLVILSPAFPANESEDTWVVSQQLFVKTAKKKYPGLNITVLSFFYPYQSIPYHWNDIPVIPFDGMKKRKWRRPLLWWQIWNQLNNIRKEKDILGIFSFWCGECALIGGYYGGRYKIKHFTWICGQDARSANKLVKFIKPHPTSLVAMSPFLAREFFVNHKIKPAHIIHNAIDPSAFPTVLPAERDIDILGAGSFEIPKQYHVLAEIVASLRESIPGIRCYHTGMGPEKDNVQAMINQLQLENNLSLLGVKPHQEVLRLMQRTKVFVHPSLYEGFSTVCLEALFAGAHVISFCYPLEKPVANWHVVHTTEEMKLMAEKILTDPHTVYKSSQLFSMDETVEQVMELFDVRET